MVNNIIHNVSGSHTGIINGVPFFECDFESLKNIFLLLLLLRYEYSKL